MDEEVGAERQNDLIQLVIGRAQGGDCAAPLGGGRALCKVSAANIQILKASQTPLHVSSWVNASQPHLSKAELTIISLACVPSYRVHLSPNAWGAAKVQLLELSTWV